MSHESEVPLPEVDPAAMSLPAPRETAGVAWDLTHIEEALRRSGLDSEVAEALPVRGGDSASQYWGSWEQASWSGALRSSRHLAGVDAIRWPQSLYIPPDSDYRDFWFAPPPDRNRYALAWPARGDGRHPSWASADSGELFAFATTPWTDPAAESRGEAGIGVSYTPDFALGLVNFTPTVNVRYGLLTAVLDYGPMLVSAGTVVLQVDVVLAVWQVVPGGFDLVDYGVHPVARIARDQSWGGPERNRLPGSLYTPRTFTRPFLVQGGRDYAFGVVARAQTVSTLTDSGGGPLVVPSAETFKVYASVMLMVPDLSIETSIVYIK